MTRGLRIRPAAEADILDAHRWYGQQRPGLAAEFVAALDATLARVAEMPAAHPVVHRNVRRALVQRFPYGVFYVVGSRTVSVVAVMHQARDPQRWKARAPAKPRGGPTYRVLSRSLAAGRA